MRRRSPTTAPARRDLDGPRDVPVPDLTPPPSRAASVARPAAVYVLLFGAYGAYAPYVALYLGSRGLDLGTVGVLISLYAAAGLVAAPAWGAVADALRDARGPILAASLLSAASMALFGTATAPVTLAIGIAALAASWAGITPMVDSRAVRIIQRERFGQARAWGSAAFIVMTFVAGAVVDRLGPSGMFLLYAPLTVVMGVAAWWLLRLPGDRDAAARDAVTPGRGRARDRSGDAPRSWLRTLAPGGVVEVLRLPRVGVFFVASIAIWSSLAAIQGFVSLRVAALGGDATMVAAVFALAAALEVPLMLAFPRLARRVGTERLIVIGAAAFAVRALATAVATSAEQIVAVALFGGIGFAFVYVGTVTWVAAAVPHRILATAQGVVTGTSVSLGAIVGSALGGRLGAAFGLPVLFGVAAAGFALGGILVWVAIARGRVAGDPAAAPI